MKPSFKLFWKMWDERAGIEQVGDLVAPGRDQIEAAYNALTRLIDTDAIPWNRYIQVCLYDSRGELVLDTETME